MVRAPGFQGQWEEGLQNGRVPPGRQASLERVCPETLARVPWIGAVRPGRPEKYRTVLVPGLAYRIPGIGVGYRIMEDGMTVILGDVGRVGTD